MLPLAPDETLALASLADSMGVPVGALHNLIFFESGWNPAARNPLSGASGLIQFTDSTARALGYESAAALVARHPSRVAQLQGPVTAYFARLKPFSGTLQDLYMSVFYPAARKWHPLTQFPANVRKVNPGIVTVADYIRKVQTRAGLKYVAPASAALLLAAAVVYFALSR